MLQPFEPEDEVLSQESFSRDEAAFNLIHTISASSDSWRLKSPDGRMIFAQTPGRSGWLWLDPELAEQEMLARMQELKNALMTRATLQEAAPTSFELPGISAKPHIARLFSDLYAGVGCWTSSMTMEAYHCPIVNPPRGVKGGMQRVEATERLLAAEFLAGMVRDVYGKPADGQGQLTVADNLIRDGRLFFWIGDTGDPSAMAGIGGTSPRHGRINAVYTPPDRRRRGYCSALVAEVAGLLVERGLIPMLYADCVNPDSNKVYRSIGFQPAGKIEDIKFDRQP
ncbi:GNAT family N-acetyltransferase [Paenibacillus herberti]|uniref:GNAT family N-acetyltransferase n=1 Tax=Paenibacillus herberti TaxID=1619309 RepID=A0A229P127_9BACL|nr:GNAT family N-acetyltransferase [Paenibacillus herberti]OXM15902.1 GNAT family N-acetyltransferase [Paenibacillus herberti]